MGFQWKLGKGGILIWWNNLDLVFYLWGMPVITAPCISPLQTLLVDSISVQRSKWKYLWKENSDMAGKLCASCWTFFPPTTCLGFLGRSPVFQSKYSWSRQEQRKRDSASEKLCSWFHIWSSGAKEHNHAEHHEDIPQGDEDSKVSEAQQELPDVVTCARFSRLLPKALRVLLFPLICCVTSLFNNPPCPAHHSYACSHGRCGEGGPKVPDAGLRVQARAKRFLGDGPEALVLVSRGISGESDFMSLWPGGSQEDGP